MTITRKITSADKIAAENLRRLWDSRKKSLGLTQEKVAAEEFDATQGLISQYLNGNIALGPVAVLRFARVLKCKPQEIRADFKGGAQDVRRPPSPVAQRSGAEGARASNRHEPVRSHAK